MPTLEADRYGEWPPGLHWTPGKRRDLEVKGDPPSWLKEVSSQPPKKKAPKKPTTKEE